MMENNKLACMNALHCKNMFLKEDRIKSFAKWPYNGESKSSVENMADAGWIMIGDVSDIAAECFICGIQLDAWESDDDPWYEHTKRGVNCPFIKLNKKQNDMTVSEICQLAKEYYRVQMDRQRTLMKKNLDLGFNFFKQKNKEKK